MRKECVSCAYYQLEDITRGYICCNGDSKNVADWVEPHDTCDQWEQSDLSKSIEEKNKRRENLLFIISTYGSKSQEDMAIEEMAELQKAILKNRRKPDEETMLAIIDELADVEIMVEQLKIIYSCSREVEKRINYKIERQIHRILDQYGINGRK